MSRIAVAWTSSISSSSHQAGARLLDRRRAPDQRDDLVQRVERLDQTAQDVGALLRLAQPVGRTPDDDLDLVRHVVPDELGQVQRARHAVDQREHVGAERLLQLGVLVEVVQHDLRHGVALEHEDQAQTGTAARLVADVGDSGELALADQLGAALGQVVGVHLVRQLGHDQAACARACPPRRRPPRASGSSRGRCGRRPRSRRCRRSGRRSGSPGPSRSGSARRAWSASSASGWSRHHCTAAAISRRLCGGIFVAMPTAMPSEPLTSRFGNRAGRIAGSCVRPS